VDISSTHGKKTTVSITIPQTLSIIQGLQVIIEDENYFIPSEAVMEIIPASQYSSMSVQGRPILVYRGSPIAVADLTGVLGIRYTDGSAACYVITGNTSIKVAIPVNMVIGEHDVLIKHLGEAFSNVAGILGIGVLGGGRMSLIIDTDFLLQHYATYSTAASI